MLVLGHLSEPQDRRGRGQRGWRTRAGILLEAMTNTETSYASMGQVSLIMNHEVNTLVNKFKVSKIFVLELN